MADVVVWLVTLILGCIGGLLVEALAAVIIWYMIVFASPRAGRSIAETMLQIVEEFERALRERGL